MFLSAFSDEATLARIKALGAIAYLVKPLDIRQIVPAVEAAFASQQTRQRDAVVPPGGVATTEPADAQVLSQVTAIAVGIAMHRFSLNRQQALERLRKLAAHERLTLDEQARRFVAALETLSAPNVL